MLLGAILLIIMIVLTIIIIINNDRKNICNTILKSCLLYVSIMIISTNILSFATIPFIKNIEYKDKYTIDVIDDEYVYINDQKLKYTIKYDENAASTYATITETTYPKWYQILIITNNSKQLKANVYINNRSNDKT